MKLTKTEYDELCNLIHNLQRESIDYGILKTNSSYQRMHCTEDELIMKLAKAIQYEEK